MSEVRLRSLRTRGDLQLCCGEGIPLPVISIPPLQSSVPVRSGEAHAPVGQRHVTSTEPRDYRALATRALSVTRNELAAAHSAAGCSTCVGYYSYGPGYTAGSNDSRIAALTEFMPSSMIGSGISLVSKSHSRIY